MDKDFILKIYNQSDTIFTIDQIAQLFPAVSNESLRDRLYYFSQAGKLRRLRQGIYAKKSYNQYELANKIYKPSYISLETVLAKEGAVFQYYESVFAVSYLTRTVEIDQTEIQYRQIKDTVLTNTQEVEEKSGYFIATLERAFLDAVYIYKNYHFDNLSVLNWDKVNNLGKIYENKSFEKRIEGYYKLSKAENGKH